MKVDFYLESVSNNMEVREYKSFEEKAIFVDISVMANHAETVLGRKIDNSDLDEFIDCYLYDEVSQYIEEGRVFSIPFKSIVYVKDKLKEVLTFCGFKFTY